MKSLVKIMPKKGVLDPQGKAVSQSMNNLGLAETNNVRIGKHITLHIESKDINSAEKVIEEACKKWLCNQIMENFSFELEEVS